MAIEDEPKDPELLTLYQRNAVESALLRLPGEIRNKIYSYVLTEKIPIDITRRMQMVILRAQANDVRATFQLPRVCRQFYIEFSALIYASSIITYNFPETGRWITVKAEVPPRMLATITVVHLLNLRCLQDKNTREWAILKTEFPALEKIIIPRWNLYGKSPVPPEEEMHVADVQGKDVEIVFVDGGFRP